MSTHTPAATGPEASDHEGDHLQILDLGLKADRILCPICLDHNPRSLLSGECPLRGQPRPAGFACSCGNGVDSTFWTDHTNIVTLQSSYLNGCQLCSLIYRALEAYKDVQAVDFHDSDVEFMFSISLETGIRLTSRKHWPPGTNKDPDTGIPYDFWTMDNREIDVHIMPLKPEVAFWADVRRTSPWPTHLQSDELLDWIRVCIEKCETQHKDAACCQPPTTILPSRVVHFGDVGCRPKLVLDTRGMTARYVALSHCWGRDPVMKLTRSTLEALQDGIDILELPQTFQDAIAVTRALGVEYLWIDALCIIQDDARDWEFEAGQMAAVYSSAYFVLVAVSAHSDTEGFVRPLRERWPAKSLACSVESGIIDSFVQARRDPTRRYTAEPLLQRAWSFQESLLARRIVSCEDNAVRYTCNETITHDMDGDDTLQYEVEIVKLKLRDQLSGRQWMDIDQWTQLVKAYTRRALTVSSDRLPALAGVARKINQQQSSRYLAGIWDDHLPWALMWYASNRGDPEPTLALQRSPSFSWCSAPDMIEQMDFQSEEVDLECIVDIREAHCFPSGPDPYGHVSWGFVRLVGTLVPAELFWDDGYRPDPCWRLATIDNRPTPNDLIGQWSSDRTTDRPNHNSENNWDAKVVARADAGQTNALPYLARSRGADDCGVEAKRATVTLLVFGWRRYHGTYNPFPWETGENQYFLVLAPTDKPEGLTAGCEVFERIGLLVRVYFEGETVLVFDKAEREIVIV